MKVKSINSVGRKPVYDLSVKSDNYDEQQYVLENGVVTHNTGIYYSSDNIWIVGRRQNKKGTDIIGYDFVINVEKSRYVKEKSKIPISVTWDGGVSEYSGLLDVALAGEYARKPSNGWYEGVNPETGEVLTGKARLDATQKKEFWDPIFANTDFAEFITKQYQMGKQSTVNMDEIVEEDAY